MSALKVPELTKWFFESEGERKGPFSEDEIVCFIKNGSLDRNTSIWKSGSPDWINASESELKDHFNFSEPPPLAGKSINNSLVWVLAFAPIAASLIQGFLAGLAASVNGNPLLTNEYYSNLWFVPIVLNIALCVSDELRLKKAGHSSKKLGTWVWLVPVYLFQRAKLLKQSVAYFVVWLVCFGISLMM